MKLINGKMIVKRIKILLFFISTIFLFLLLPLFSLANIEYGIAQNYPEDENIKDHPSVMHATGFETPNWHINEFGATSDLKTGYEHTTDENIVLTGEGALQIQQTQGTHNPNEFYSILDETEIIYLRWYRRYEEGYDWTQHKMPGVYAKVDPMAFGGPLTKPTGYDKYSCKLYVDFDGKPAFYSYHPDQPDDWGDHFAQNIGDQIVLESDRWYSFEMMIKANTASVYDGELKMWIDGELKGHITEIKFRDTADLKINLFTHSAYVGGNWVSEQDQKLWEDNLVIATEYIGPMVETGVYYVSVTNGDDSYSGNKSNPFKSIQHALNTAVAGERIIIREGTYTESLTFPNAGTIFERITMKSYPGEEVKIKIQGKVIDIDNPYITIDGFIIDGDWGTEDIIQVGDNADNLILKNVEVMNTRRDCIDMASPENVLVENSKIHDCINVQDGNREDAHALVTYGVKNLIINNSEFYYVSGDTLQFQYNGWDNIIVENTILWNAKLPTSRGGAPAGVDPGENAVDTKYEIADGRGRLFLKNVTAYGWRSDYISNAAAFNIKHNVEVVFDGVTTYDNEIAFRLRGPGSRGGAHVTLKNIIIYDSDKGVRYEDNIENLKIYNSIFGKNIDEEFESAGGYGSGFEVNNNIFLDTLPTQASDSSNLVVEESDFIDIDSNNYHYTNTSPAIDVGIEISDVLIDRDGLSRSMDNIYDVGAYEFDGEKCVTLSNEFMKEQIDEFLADSTNSIQNLINQIILWKKGCN
jgi:hypothetical protein